MTERDMKLALEEIIEMTESMKRLVDHGLDHFPETVQLDRINAVLDHDETGPCEAGSIMALLGIAITRMHRLGLDPVQSTVVFAQVMEAWQAEEDGIETEPAPESPDGDPDSKLN